VEEAEGLLDGAALLLGLLLLGPVDPRARLAAAWGILQTAAGRAPSLAAAKALLTAAIRVCCPDVDAETHLATATAAATAAAGSGGRSAGGTARGRASERPQQPPSQQQQQQSPQQSPQPQVAGETPEATQVQSIAGWLFRVDDERHVLEAVAGGLERAEQLGDAVLHDVGAVQAQVQAKVNGAICEALGDQRPIDEGQFAALALATVPLRRFFASPPPGRGTGGT